MSQTGLMPPSNPSQERLLTPSKIAAWLDCAHYLTLKHEVEAGTRKVEFSPFGEMARMLVEKGLAHEQAVLQRYRDEGLTVFEVPDREDRESFAQWVSRVENPLTDGHDVVFQMPFVHAGIRGVADFFVRVDDEESGTFNYEPVDAKLARHEAKPGHVLQLCFYAEAIAATTGTTPEHIHLALGSGATETIRVADVLPYWRRLRGQLATVVGTEPTGLTDPEPCDHCGFCEFELACEAEWRVADSLVHVADVRRVDRATLRADGVETIAALATLDRPVAELDAGRQERFVRQAALQVKARNAPDQPPPFELLADPPDPEDTDDEDPETAEPTGFAAMPEPDGGDVFLDFEGHPFWRADAELFFLFGLIERSPSGEWEFKAFWAHDLDEEAVATVALIDHLTARRVQFPNMHVYHYNHTERSSLERLTIKHGVAELDLERLIQTGQFIDLLPIVKGAMQVGVESYGLKHIERLTDYQRGHEIDQGAGAVVEYERWMASQEPDCLDRIANYNEDDVRATRALRDWLVGQRPAGLSWRAAVLDTYEPDAELDDRIEALHAFGPGTIEHLMGDLLGYWRREKSAVAADVYRLATADEAEQFDSLSAIARLSFVGTEPQFSVKTGKQLKWPLAVFTFPDQPIHTDIDVGEDMIVALNEQQWAFFEIASLDRSTHEIRLVWKGDCQERGLIPSSLVHYSWYPERAKLTALQDLADELLAGNANRVGHSILRQEEPRFLPGHGPAGGVFTGEVADICRWVTGLDNSFVAIQGPPGTGKTFTGAHIIHTLVKAGKRVGVTAMSHYAIDNLMEAVVERFEEEGDVDALRAVRKAKHGSVPASRTSTTTVTAPDGNFNVVAGTAWFCASSAIRDNPVDVLVIDEAGQLGLADTLAATISADNVILLGDPQQLPQVSQASHPGGAGASALEHLLGDALTISNDRGVLLDVTWRLHPDVCRFISDVMYGGKLNSHESCSNQATNVGTGLRWLRARARSVLDRIDRRGGNRRRQDRGTARAGVDRSGRSTRPLTAADFIVVAPYNDHRRCIQARLCPQPSDRAG